MHADEDPSTTLLWTPRPGSRVSCEVFRRIGAGGFAEVFEAELQRPQQPPLRVALKRLLPALRGDPLRQRQLRREAQIAACLNHPNIVKVLSLVELNDEVAVAMELVEGVQGNRLLHHLGQCGLRLRTATVAHIATGLFSALAYLEDPLGRNRPLVHADISLENLMLTTSGEVKLIDFGIAAEELVPTIESRADVALAEEALTSLHQAAGKRSYLPPGLPRRGPSSQGDFYAAGVCFWELFAGRRFPILPPGVGGREMGSLIAFAAADLPTPAWLLLKSCLSVDGKTRLRTAAEGLLLCQELGGESEAAAVATVLGRLVRAAMAPASSSEPASELSDLDRQVIERQDFLAALSGRLHAAFAAHRVLILDLAEQDPKKQLSARYGAELPDAPRPALALLRKGLEAGFLEAPDGTLLVRVRPPQSGARPHLLFLEPGPNRAYDPLAQSVLRSLLCPESG